MCEQVAVELPALPAAAAAAAARRFVADRCGDWGLDEVCADLALPVSELVTNAVLHARSPATRTPGRRSCGRSA